MAKRLGGTRKLNRTNLEAVPDRSGVYLIKNKKGEPKYVGASARLRTRLAQHLNQRDVPGAHSFTVRPVRSKKQATDLEGSYIKRYRPTYNILKKK